MQARFGKLVALNRSGELAVGVVPNPNCPEAKAVKFTEPTGPAETGTGRTERVSPLTLVCGVILKSSLPNVALLSWFAIRVRS